MKNFTTHSNNLERQGQWFFGRADRYSALRTKHHVTFTIYAPDAQEVYLVAEFNDWDPYSIPLKKMPDGYWKVEMDLPHGHHQYYFLVDGKRTLDPRAYGIGRDKDGNKVSIVAVS